MVEEVGENVCFLWKGIDFSCLSVSLDVQGVVEGCRVGVIDEGRDLGYEVRVFYC